ncbi:TraB/GumN family protein [Phenylobacterium sp.]|uniref:TraB/GumN family protein n=1 Tax=Phenylobacterium sp. TaxID=1871053 RepID=UPI0027338CEA|nr:TraB/GumN family protein [Phenylobacterium sp.]MDP3855950.1 TraB/GumN family protein [Phenylobacterium sp.]
MLVSKGLFAGLLALVLAACGPAQAKPPFWVVRDADSEVLLFGSVHVLRPGLNWRPAELDAALTKADDLWFELPIDSVSEARVAQLAATQGLLPQGQSLTALLSPDGARRLAKASESLGVGLAVIDRLEPWFAEVLLAGAHFRRTGADTSAGVEKILSASAPASAQRKAFETPDEQVAIFDSAPLKEQAASLERSLIELETDPDAYEALVADWMVGDVAAIDEQALGPLREAAPGLYARLVTQRNERWLSVLRARLAGTGRTVVVVGVGHLVGDDGLPARLRALGYSVEGP